MRSSRTRSSLMWNRAELFDPSRGALSTWLLAIARNLAIHRLRAATRHERAATFSSFGRDEADDQSTVEWLTWTGDLIAVAGPEPGPEMALSDKETRGSIQDALAVLPPLERTVIELAYEAASRSPRSRPAGQPDRNGQDEDETGTSSPPRSARGERSRHHAGSRFDQSLPVRIALLANAPQRPKNPARSATFHEPVMRL